MQRQATMRPQLRRKTSLQQSLIEQYEHDVREMRQASAQLERDNARLFMMAGIDEPFLMSFGMGGEKENAFASKSGRFQNFSEVVDHKAAYLTTLKEDILHQQSVVLRLEEFFDAQTHMLASIPSIWPVPGETGMSSKYGMRTHPITGEYTMHWGIDIGAAKGTPIIATADGVVAFSGERGTFGNVMVLDHGYGYTTFYGHCSVLEKQIGAHVKRGDVIARVGSTGRSTFNHLHYEIRVDGAAKDPLQFIVGMK
jgi:murein DD-endopeptidase MepM/ murein hydrolase activator NlpD